MAHPYKGKLYSHLKSLLPKLFLNILIHKTRRLTKIIYGKILICFLKNSIQKKKKTVFSLLLFILKLETIVTVSMCSPE